MTRRKTPVGGTTEVRYHVRSDDGPWQAADPGDSALSRARRGRQWRARCRMRRADGSMTQLSRSGPTPKAALAELDRLIAAERNSAVGEEEAVPTLGELVQWVVRRIEEGRDPKIGSSNSQRTYVGIACRWAGYRSALQVERGSRRSHIRTTRDYESDVYGLPIDTVTPADLADEIERVADEGGGTSLPQLRAIWRKAALRAIALRHITADPASGLKLPAANDARGKKVYSNGSNRPRDNSLSNAQLDLLREKVAVRYPRQRLDVGDLIILGSYTGLRISEANSLRWTDIHLDAEIPYISVSGQVFGYGADREWRPQLKTDSSRRTVPLPTPAVELLRARLGMVLADESLGEHSAARIYVFPSATGGVPNLAAAAKAVRRTLDRAGLPWVTFHTLRRTVERQLMDADVDARVIMAVMGHDPATSWSAYVDRNVDVSAVTSVLR